MGVDGVGKVRVPIENGGRVWCGVGVVVVVDVGGVEVVDRGLDGAEEDVALCLFVGEVRGDVFDVGEEFGGGFLEV